MVDGVMIIISVILTFMFKSPKKIAAEAASLATSAIPGKSKGDTKIKDRMITKKVKI
jgi:hypothetical protein